MEFIAGRLYFALNSSLLELSPEKPGDLFISLDDIYQHTKVRKHFGPPSLKIIWKHCDEVDAKLKKFNRVVFLTNSLNDNIHIEQRTLSAFLMATYAILRLQWGAEKVNDTLLTSIPARLAFFRDYHGDSSYKLNIMDCLAGLHIGCNINKWFTSYPQTKFPQSTNSHLDMNWIIPGVLLAFKDPTVNRSKDNRSISKAFIKELKRCGINVIIRLNGNDHNTNIEYYGNSYNASDLKKEQFYHYEIPFRDVGTPSTSQAHQFVALCERYGAKIAVHCHAGLGRTATMVGCYLIKHFNFTSRSVCGWLKLCRRGSVMGPQHFFLDKYQTDLDNIKKTMSVDTPLDTQESIPARFSRDVISPMARGATTVATEIARAPRKNNIIHITPVNTKQRNRGDQHMQKYKFDNPVERVESIRAKAVKASAVKKRCVSPKQTRSSTPSAQCLISTSKSILHPKLIKSRELTSKSNLKIVQNKSTTTVTKEYPPKAKKAKRHVTSKTRTSYVNIPRRKSQTKIEPMRSKTQDKVVNKSPIARRNVESRTPSNGRIKSARLVQGTKSWSQWSGNVIEGLVSQSKSRLYGFMNTVYSP